MESNYKDGKYKVRSSENCYLYGYKIESKKLIHIQNGIYDEQNLKSVAIEFIQNHPNHLYLENIILDEEGYLNMIFGS